MADELFKSLFEGDAAYHVPNYQRAYAWRHDKQLRQFLTDLEEQPVGKKYYLGHFLLERHDNTSKPQFNVIDGQQRLTTAIIFFSALAEELQVRESNGETLIDSDGDKVEPWLLNRKYLEVNNKPRLRTVAADHYYFEKAIIKRSTEEKPDPKRQAQIRIQEAQALFKKRFKQEDTQTLLRWLQLVEEAVITKYEVTGKVQATQIFAFQNDRGIDLTELEKLKAYLMYRAYLDDATNEVEYTIKHVEDRFGEMYQLSEEIGVNENTVFSYHSAAFSQGGEGFDSVKKSLKEQSASNRAIWIRDYTDQLRKSFVAVRDLEELARGYSAITGILYLDAGSSWPLLLRIQRHFSDKPAQREQLFRSMETILFKKAYSTGNYRTNDFHWLARESDGDFEALQTKLAEWAEKGFRWWWAFTTDFKRRLTSDHHYGGTTRYLLWQYENHLRRNAKQREMSGADLYNTWGRGDWQQTLDHITPQNPVGMVYTEEFVEKYLHNLGNLSLMTQGANSRKSNNVAQEAEAYRKSTNLSDLEIGEMMRETNQWGQEQIAVRAKRIVAFAESYWLGDS